MLASIQGPGWQWPCHWPLLGELGGGGDLKGIRGDWADDGPYWCTAGQGGLEISIWPHAPQYNAVRAVNLLAHGSMEVWAYMHLDGIWRCPAKGSIYHHCVHQTSTTSNLTTGYMFARACAHAWHFRCGGGRGEDGQLLTLWSDALQSVFQKHFVCILHN